MSAKFIFCEGKDDVAVISAIAGSASVSGLTVEDFGGRDKLREFLKAARLRPEFATKHVISVAVVLDADNDCQANWQRIRDAVNYSFDVSLNAPGEFHGDQPRIAGWLVPGSGRAGMLETMCMDSVRHEREFGCVEEFSRCVRERAGRNLHPKAVFRVWTATQADYSRSLADRARTPGFVWSHPAFDALKGFLVTM